MTFGITCAAMPEYSLPSNATPEEAAALISAIERFLADTSSPALEAPPAVNGWLRASLLEGIGERDEHAVWK